LNNTVLTVEGVHIPGCW